MHQYISKLKSIFDGYDFILLGSTAFLMATGLASLFSTTYPGLSNFYKQIIWIAIGVALMVVFSSFDYTFFRVHSFPVLALYFVGILGLVAVLFLGTPIRGARSWIQLGPINIETVEILKLILILILAKYFSMRHVEMYRLRHVVISGVYILIPSVLIIMQPDIGSFSILLAIWAGIMLIAGIKLKHLTMLAVLAVIISMLAWSFLLVDYQKARIASFVDPAADPYGAGYNSRQAVVAVASGGIWGKGFMQGTQAQLGFLPEVQTDFIYAALIEELGIFIALFILLLYGILFWRLAVISKHASDNFAKLAVLGFAVMLMGQIFLNIGMNFGMLPITGLTLPFISYGGSSLVSLMIGLGIVQNIHKNYTKRGLVKDEAE